MNQTTASSTPVSPGQTYRIKALHVAEKLKLINLKDRLSMPVTEFSNYELVVRYAEDSYLFVYNYGSVVFFNVPDAVQERELSAIHDLRAGTDFNHTTEAFLVEVQPASVDSVNKVYFDRVVLTSLSFARIKIVCMLIGESTALEYYEILIENLLEKTNTFSKKLEKQGRFLESSEDLIKFIGLCLNTKQEIISNLYIVDSPEETWESVELDKLFSELKAMVEIDTRYRALEYKIKIIQESIEIIVDLAKTKRETMLELIIILLIAFEVVLSIIKFNSH
ncbi:MAG: RMD1 family protein [Methylotenera sp.]|nr:RMD1 family protein [Oligoflexia bacterium]